MLKRDGNMILYGCPATGTESSSVPSLVRLPYIKYIFANIFHTCKDDLFYPTTFTRHCHENGGFRDLLGVEKVRKC